MSVESATADPDQNGLGVKSTAHEHGVKSVEFLNGTWCAKGVTYGKKDVIVTAREQHGGSATIGERIWEHHTPREATEGVRGLRFDNPSFGSLEEEFVPCVSVPIVDCLAFEFQVNRAGGGLLRR
jgi:hypothetical protein